jgi:hypothetical protein
MINFLKFLNIRYLYLNDVTIFGFNFARSVVVWAFFPGEMLEVFDSTDPCSAFHCHLLRSLLIKMEWLRYETFES